MDVDQERHINPSYNTRRMNEGEKLQFASLFSERNFLANKDRLIFYNGKASLLKSAQIEDRDTPGSHPDKNNMLREIYGLAFLKEVGLDVPDLFPLSQEDVVRTLGFSSSETTLPYATTLLEPSRLSDLPAEDHDQRFRKQYTHAVAASLAIGFWDLPVNVTTTSTGSIFIYDTEKSFDPWVVIGSPQSIPSFQYSFIEAFLGRFEDNMGRHSAIGFAALPTLLAHIDISEIPVAIQKVKEVNLEVCKKAIGPLNGFDYLTQMWLDRTSDSVRSNQVRLPNLMKIFFGETYKLHREWCEYQGQEYAPEIPLKDIIHILGF